MKKTLIVFGVLIALSACGVTSTSAEKEQRFTQRDNDLTITTDKVTGCKYIIYDSKSGYAGAGGITPLMSPDGSQDCD